MTRIYHLGIEETLAVIGGKWKPLLLCHLGNGPQRPGELHRKVDGITQKMLTQQLRELETDGIITRKVYAQVPPKVEYGLTERGKSLRNVLVAMSEWGEASIKARAAEGETVELKNMDYSGYLNY
ncbi:winged helix-turn-helix transcriptional regulator [Lacticaseibacillus saniviri]|uniref:winged helix-turn-helix transcriptional regulator n=1 Tax=Lacticaseibacillus saniviri TaxID=931533 RepID=UPI00070545BB|nr:helix-turn-helix domain-containing protein [Lacticaseibacillus saniviri]MCG4281923.1 helix-turn-helix transcriptional regulator [Lacticaseibacillus saniviri]